jgi:sucrose-phosphate synthase
MSPGRTRVTGEHGLYLVLISIHGLIRGRDLELGRDPDTGGQVTYVLELVRHLARHPRVARVDLFTRQIFDKEVGPDYAEPIEPLDEEGARIVRIPCGPKRYIRKELLWHYLDEFVDRTVSFLHRQRHTPHLFHSHYADAGYVGRELSRFLGIPLVHTGHSLGRAKRSRLLDSGELAERIERRYRLRERIQTEERVLEHAGLIVCSTRQEVEEQWGEYRNAYNTEMAVIPPGTDTTRFTPPGRNFHRPAIQAVVDPFLRHPRRPMILALARADPRKNLRRLVEAYAGSERLKAHANLVIVAGNRDDVRDLEETARHELTELMLDVDRYSLYGHVAMPKHHTAEDVPNLYRLAMRRRGVFVNAALTEPFGLTLIEAAACGLPVVATDDGGPRDILTNCRNGFLVDALDTDAIAARIEDVIFDKERWRRFSQSGQSGVRRHYTWTAHVNKYVKEVTAMINRLRPQGVPRKRTEASRKRLLQLDRLLVCDIDNTLVGDRDSLRRLLDLVAKERQRLGFVVATGRSLELTMKVLEDENISRPDILITSVGTEIHEGPYLDPAIGWTNHLKYCWDRDAVVKAVQNVPGLTLQGPEGQRPCKVSCYVDGSRVAPKAEDPAQEGGRMVQAEVERRLRDAGVRFNTIFSHGQFLDILPLRASKGKAIRYIADKWEIPVERVLVAGDSGNDEEMLRGSTLGVVVGNYSPELEVLRGRPRIYFARETFASGILEGMAHYDFLNPEGPDPDRAPES